MDQNLDLNSYQMTQQGNNDAGTQQTQPFAQEKPQMIAPAGKSQSQRPSSIRKTNVPSCHSCRRRKVKCDRANPCTPCVRAGQQCVSSAFSSAPRGRQGGRPRKVDTELLDRIAKLENLVKNMEGDTSNPNTGVRPTAAQTRATSEESQTSTIGEKLPKLGSNAGLDRYLGGSLWMSLSDEINGMREVLNQSSDEEDNNDLTPKSSSPDQHLSNGSDFVVLQADNLANLGDRLIHPTRWQIQSLFSSFIANVEPNVKILHGPSLWRYLVEGTGQLDCSPGPRGWEALNFAIYYTATTSLTPAECSQQLGEEKSVLLARFRSSTELALAKVDFVNTEDMSVLQALVLYLFATRSNENSRRTWTLTSLAVRIAHALGLHREKLDDQQPSPYQPFEREMRRRLWWEICFLDRQASVDRGSDPIIVSNSFSTQLPLNINDRELIPGSPEEVHPRSEYTDSTLSLVCHEIFDVERRLNYTPAGGFDTSQVMAEDPWAQRRAWVIACQQRLEDNYLRHCDMAIPVQRYTKFVADIMTAIMWLLVYRPLQRQPHYTSVLIPEPGILYLCVEVVEKANQVSKDSALGNFRWFSQLWTQWHALAVMIAELCVQSEGPTVERAWTVVESMYKETAQYVADTDKGKLWRPIKKLMKKAHAVRMKHLEDVAARQNVQPVSDSFQGGGYQQNNWPSVQYQNSSMIGISNVMTSGAEYYSPSMIGTSNTMSSGNNYSTLPQQPRYNPMATGPTLINWDSWIDPGSSMPPGTNAEMNQMAWNNWENFIDDFQADGHLMPGQEETTPPFFDTQ